MSKKRVYEIARERGLTTQQVMRRLTAENIEVKAAASTVSDEDIARVFGEKRESVSPATQGLPSWLSPSASSGPRTTTRAALDEQSNERQRKADLAKNAKSRALEQAKALRAQLAAKRAQQSAANEAAATKQDEEDAADAIVAAEVAAAGTPRAAAVVEAAEPVIEEAPASDVGAPAAAEVAGSTEAPADSEVAEAPAEAAAEAETATEPVSESTAADTTDAAADAERVGPRMISRAPDAVEEAPVVEPPAAVAAEPEAGPAAPAKPVSEAAQRRIAQVVAGKRVAEIAARKRAQLETDKVNAEQVEKDKERGIKKKEKKDAADAKKDGATTTEEFIGSRKPRVGAGSGTDSERGSRRGPSKRRRVVIDSGAARRGGDSGRGGGRGRKGGRGGGRVEPVVIDPTIPVTVHAGSTVKELADALGVPATEIIKVLMGEGDFVTITVSLNADQIETVSIGLEPSREILVRTAADDDIIPVFEDAEEDMVTRAPVVTIMGHVDHGKTSLLDALRETKVAAGEAGGITQHIGAYQVEIPYEGGMRRVTFLDTPGHEAFTALRARGAKVTDEAVLVVAADDGVKPQTIEAIDHARAADVPIIVAINKIDKENAQVEKVKSELAQHGLQPIEWGGDIETVEVSAKQRINLDALIETILLQADVLELKANPNADASGYVIESKLDPGRGPVCTMLIARGTLKVGDAIVAGASWGKVRALSDFRGLRVKTAEPAMPVEIVGFDSVPDAGEFCQVVASERVARDMAAKRAMRLKSELLAKRQRGLSLEDLFARIKEGEVQELNLIVKADVAGSIEAIEQELGKIQHSEVKIRIIHSGVGAITGNDIMLASASSAIVLGFNVRPNTEARVSAEREGVDVRSYTIIYKLREDVELALSGLLRPEEVEEILGEAEVRALFKVSRLGTIAGCMVTSGKIERSARVRVMRDGGVAYEGEIDSLKRNNDDVREVPTGAECGILVKNFNDVKEGDTIEAFTINQVERDIMSELVSTKA